MPTESAIATRMRTALAEYLKRDLNTITASHSLRDDLGLDSMATIELLFKIEETFDLQIPDQDLPKLVTVANVIAYVEDKVAPSAVPAGKPAKRPVSKKKG